MLNFIELNSFCSIAREEASRTNRLNSLLIKNRDQKVSSKCGNQMHERWITRKTNGSVKRTKILQCKICRHWVPLD